MDSKKAYPFEFSVVMAVYNVEPFLREAVDSLIEQDFGFENIQLIMVDDGSTDDSGAVCDEYAQRYPENVLVIHKENGGVASARNEGLKYATGRFLNFMDSDDKFSSNVMSEVHAHFCQWETQVDIVTIPLQFFDAMNGPHWQNGKFNRGTRILDLFWDYQSIIMFVNASFFANRVKKRIDFDSFLVCGEDMKVLLTVLAERMKLGVVSTCKYMYRRRSGEATSLIQTAKKKHGWYFDYFTYLIDWAVAFYRKRFGYVPSFLQYELMADLQWRFGQVYAMEEVLTGEEIGQYQDRLFQSLRYFDDKYILEQKMVWAEHKCYMLAKKYGKPPKLTPRQNDILVHFDNSNINCVSDHYTKIEFVKISNNMLSIEGFTKIFGVTLDEPLEVFVEANTKLYRCEIIERDKINEYRFGELIFRGIEFRCTIPLEPASERHQIKIVLRCMGVDVEKKSLRTGLFAPLSRSYNNSYYFSEDRISQVQGGSLWIKRCGRWGHLKSEIAFCRELWKKNNLGSRKAILARIAYHILKLLKRRPIWLISDRIIRADDNGEAFFRYMRENHKEIRTWFVLSKDCTDYHRMKEIGPVVNNLSWMHKLLFLLCDYNISSQADDITSNPFPGYEDGVKDILSQKRFIFLQHGITKDDVSGWLNRYSKNFYGFVTAAVPEQTSILEGNYYYSEREVWKTGFPRFDRLYHDEKRYITIMPTWRKYLMRDRVNQTGVWPLAPNFRESKFCNFYRSLLNHPGLLDAADRLGYKICFLPHPTLQPHLSVFEIGDRVEALGLDAKYREIYAQSNLVMTDYSSACFDFAYLRKPVVYCHFDAEEFFKGEHVYQKGYFDYERDGFGEVEYDLQGTVDRIIEYMENGCKLKEKYRERIDKFFAFNDQNNCQRVYEKIMELEK